MALTVTRQQKSAHTLQVHGAPTATRIYDCNFSGSCLSLICRVTESGQLQFVSVYCVVLSCVFFLCVTLLPPIFLTLLHSSYCISLNLLKLPLNAKRLTILVSLLLLIVLLGNVTSLAFYPSTIKSRSLIVHRYERPDLSMLLSVAAERPRHRRRSCGVVVKCACDSCSCTWW